ncbi:MAG: UvrB/UvrC motif-containing protein [Candidatus Omnitrophica bacterium]|nr:UvrB/UvrC motif-containing protein [Candidatus Omnitrophota bacterium]
MVCNLCGTKEATIHLTEIINNQMIEIHICEECANEKGTDFKTHFSFGDLLGGIPESGKSPKTGEKKLPNRCPSCGLTYEQFGKTGRLGCGACYDSFARLLIPLIKRIQRSIRHVGKKPGKVLSEQKSPQTLKDLQERLRKCIQGEEFEEAARLRDVIRQVEEKQKKPKRGKE